MRYRFENRVVNAVYSILLGVLVNGVVLNALEDVGQKRYSLTGFINPNAKAGDEVELDTSVADHYYSKLLQTVTNNHHNVKICGYTVYRDPLMLFKVIPENLDTGKAKIILTKDIKSGVNLESNYTFEIAPHTCVSGRHLEKSWVRIQVRQPPSYRWKPKIEHASYQVVVMEGDFFAHLVQIGIKNGKLGQVKVNNDNNNIKNINSNNNHNNDNNNNNQNGNNSSNRSNGSSSSSSNGNTNNTNNNYISGRNNNSSLTIADKVDTSVEEEGGDGTVCSFEILTKGVPFEIDETGMIKNTEPLDYSKQKKWELPVVARSCDPRDPPSDKVKVIINVKSSCQAEWLGIPERMDFSPHDGKIPIASEAELDLCDESCNVTKATVSIKLNTEHIGKGCDRDTYSLHSQRKLCGADPDALDLLPSALSPDSWTHNLPTDDGKESDEVFAFDGKHDSAIVPFQIKLGREFTISTWMKHDEDVDGEDEEEDSESIHRKGNILCISDNEEMNRQHMSLFIRRCHLVLLLRQEPDSGLEQDGFAPAEWRWSLPEICDGDWHHYTVTVSDDFIPLEKPAATATKEDGDGKNPVVGKNSSSVAPAAVVADVAAVKNDAIGYDGGDNDDDDGKMKQIPAATAAATPTAANAATATAAEDDDGMMKILQAPPMPRAKLFVDGKPFIETSKNFNVVNDFPLHPTRKVHSTKAVVGGCWMGGMHHVSNHFKGYLAGLSLLNGKVESNPAIQCLTKCQEKLDFNAIEDMDSGMAVSMNSDMTSITINGPSVENVQQLLRKISYVNTRNFPTPGHRPVTFYTQLTCSNGLSPQVAPLKSLLVINRIEKPVITLSAVVNIQEEAGQIERGVGILRAFQISAHSKNQADEVFYSADGKKPDFMDKYNLDSCSVRIDDPQDLSIEQIKMPDDLIKHLGLGVKVIKDGVVISGVDKLENYERVLSALLYVNNKPMDLNQRKFKISCSELNGRYVSNTLEVVMSVIHELDPKEPEPQSVLNDKLVQSVGYLPPLVDRLPNQGQGRLKGPVSGGGQSAGSAAGVVIVCIICIGFIVLLATVGISRIRNAQRHSNVSGLEDKQEMEWDNSALTITVNPMDQEGLYDDETSLVSVLTNQNNNNLDGFDDDDFNNNNNNNNNHHSHHHHHRHHRRRRLHHNNDGGDDDETDVDDDDDDDEVVSEGRDDDDDDDVDDLDVDDDDDDDVTRVKPKKNELEWDDSTLSY